MSQEQFTVTQAAKEIGISRPTLYRYLEQPKYKPKLVAGHPVLSTRQVDAIKIERKNGTVKAEIRKNGKAKVSE